MPYLVMRSTHAEPLCYGARLYVGEDYDEADFGFMVWTSRIRGYGTMLVVF